jgi:hypothetical protein
MVKKANITEQYKERFRQICEMTSYAVDGGIEEADDQAENQPADGGGMPPMDGGDSNGGGMPPMGSGDPNGGGMPPMGGGDPNGGDMPPMGGVDPNGGGAQSGPDGFDPQVQDPNMMGGDPNGGMPPMDGGMPEGPAPEDDGVDISQLTDAQEETKDEVESLDNKFSEIMKHIGAFEELLRRNDEKIEDLKAEFEKRNPTQIEKLGLQTTKSYPFNVTPADFWKEKEATTNYSTEPDNNGVGQGQYVITKDDVNGAVDWKSISDSMDDDDFIYNQTLDGVLKI